LTQAEPAQPSPDVHLPSPIGRACPDGRSLSRTAVERVIERHQRRPEPSGRTGRAGRLSDDKGLGLPRPVDALGRLGRSSEQAVGLPALPKPAIDVGRPKSQQTPALWSRRTKRRTLPALFARNLNARDAAPLQRGILCPTANGYGHGVAPVAVSFCARSWTSAGSG
jgi:hypothetical protein